MLQKIFLNHLKLWAGGSLARRQGQERENFKLMENLSVGIQTMLCSLSESPSDSLERRFERSPVVLLQGDEPGQLIP